MTNSSLPLNKFWVTDNLGFHFEYSAVIKLISFYFTVGLEKVYHCAQKQY